MNEAPPSLAQAILASIIAGFAAALLSGVVTPLSVPVMLFSILAPAPLFLAGFAVHPLAGALGGIVAALVANLVGGMPSALLMAGMFALPAFGAALQGERAFGVYAGRPDRDGIELGRLAMVLILYLALIITLGALVIEPDYEALQARMRRVLDLAMSQVGPPAGGAEIGQILDLMAGVVLPLSGLVSFVSLVISGTLAMQIAERFGRLWYARPDFRRFRLPGGALILLGLSFFLALTAGYLGLLGEIVALCLVAAFTLQGLAVVHVRTIGLSGRGLILGAVWAALIVFGFPAFLLVGLGMVDHLADFRRGRI
jgi:hypothetical protein